MSLLAVEALEARHGLLQAVRQVSFAIAEGETVALVGANGAGKTTLLRTLAGAHRAASGRVTFRSEDITDRPSYDRAAMGVAMILVEQDLGRAMASATRTLCMLEGRIVIDAPTASLTREDITRAYFGLDRAESRGH